MQCREKCCFVGIKYRRCGLSARFSAAVAGSAGHGFHRQYPAFCRGHRVDRKSLRPADPAPLWHRKRGASLLAFYNIREEIDALVAALWNLKSGRTVSVV